MNIMFWGLMILMLLLAIGLLVYPLLKVRQAEVIAYKESNLKINAEKIKELDLDLEEERIDQVFYNSAREELDRELLIDVPAENKESASLHYTAAAKRQPALAIMIALFVPMLALLIYLDLGMHAATEETHVASQPQASEQQPSIEEMIVKLEQRIEKQGGTEDEWMMLGRAHKYVGDNKQAASAFAVALENDADNAQLMLELAEVLALENNRLFNDESRALVLKAYALDPVNANVLWFAGVAEFQAGNYKQAIQHLTTLLPMAGGEEDVKSSIIAIVSKSRQSLIDAGEEVPALEVLLGVNAMSPGAGPKASKAASVEAAATAPAVGRSLQVTIDINSEVRQKFTANDTVFVYAKAKQGPRMPLAAQRLTLAALPVTLMLDDSMAMVDGMNLSAFEQLVVSARVTKSGSAIAQSGDYIGQLDVIGNNSEAALNILIDTVVP